MDTDYPGDPLTPGVGATADAKRLPLAEAKTITKIPVLPISYADALPLLSALTGPVAPEDWRGALAITYHIGPGPAKVHLQVASNWDIKPIYDVIATLHGSQDARQWVIRGNHHDAWVNGADDPIAGQAAISLQSLDSINADLLRVSRLFLNQKGLPERPWFKNQIYAPGAYTGYGAKPIAAVREYMDEKTWSEADAQIPQVAQVIENVAAGIDKAAQEIENAIAQPH